MEDSRGSQQEGGGGVGVLGRPEEGLTGTGIPGDPSAALTPGLPGKACISAVMHALALHRNAH